MEPSRQQQLEALLQEKLGVRTPRWSDMAQDVVATKLHIHYFRGHRRLTLNDLGLQNAGHYKEAMQRIARWGILFLLPQRVVRALEHLEGKAREQLRRLSFDTPLGYLIPVIRYPDFRDEIRLLRDQFMEKIDSIVAHRSDLIDEMRGPYREAARGAYKASHGLAYSDETVAVPAAYEDEFIERLMRTIPGGEEIRRRARFDYVVEYIQPPSELAESLLAAERAQQERRTLQCQEDLRREILRKQAEMYEANIGRTVQTVATTLHRALLDACESVLASLRHNDHRLMGASATKLQNMIERVRLLNFTNNADLERYVSAIENQLTYRSRRGGRDLASVLSECATVVKAELMALGHSSETDPVAYLEFDHGAAQIDRITRAKERLLQPIPQQPALPALEFDDLPPLSPLEAPAGPSPLLELSDLARDRV